MFRAAINPRYTTLLLSSHFLDFSLSIIDILPPGSYLFPCVLSTATLSFKGRFKIVSQNYLWLFKRLVITNKNIRTPILIIWKDKSYNRLGPTPSENYCRANLNWHDAKFWRWEKHHMRPCFPESDQSSLQCQFSTISKIGALLYQVSVLPGTRKLTKVLRIVKID